MAFALVLAAVSAIAAPAGSGGVETLDGAVCRLIEAGAVGNHLPVDFLTRLIWRESSFRADAVSSAGAQGVAQFLPRTAAERGLADPFDPEQAIPKAARLLAELRDRFGNLGLAAAAYNAGPARVAAWRRGESTLPAETRAYVLSVTARDADEWAAPAVLAVEAPASRAAASHTCLALTADLRRQDRDDGVATPLAPWGVQLAGNFSKSLALAAYARARGRYAGIVGDVRPMVIGRLLRSRGTRRFYQIRIPATSRAAAEQLCDRIRGVGGSCLAARS